MGSGDWFRSIISIRRVKEGRSKKVKVHSTSEKANGCKPHVDGDTSSVANGGSERNDDIPGMLAEHIAATRIQTAFRAHIARKALCRARGALRFNVLIQGSDTQKQASNTLNLIHSWSYIQAQIRARRHHMVTEARIKQKKLENQLKLEAKLHELEVEWCGGSETMEDILSRIQQREEAAVKRERAMAYAFSHQWRANPTQYLGQAYYSLGKENWGWSWKERWIAARPWEIRVHGQHFKPKRDHCRQVSKPEAKTPLSSKPALPNEKASSKNKKLLGSIVVVQEASATAASSSGSVIPC